jgi:hypothetical protein
MTEGNVTILAFSMQNGVKGGILREPKVPLMYRPIIMNLIKLFMIFLPFFIDSIHTTFNIRILKTPLFASSPCFGKHHAILITDTNDKSNVYFLDYSPIIPSTETVFSIRMKLLFGQTVRAETRLRFIRNVSDDSQIIKSPDVFDIQDSVKSKQITDQTLQSIKEKDIKEFIKRIMDKQNGKMNLYKYNCQHFCRNTD